MADALGWWVITLILPLQQLLLITPSGHSVFLSMSFLFPIFNLTWTYWNNFSELGRIAEIATFFFLDTTIKKCANGCLLALIHWSKCGCSSSSHNSLNRLASFLGSCYPGVLYWGEKPHLMSVIVFHIHILYKLPRMVFNIDIRHD